MEHSSIQNHSGHGLEAFLAIILAAGALIFDSIPSIQGDTLFTISKVAAIAASCGSLAVSSTIIYEKYIKKK